jgi:Uma2 family endonuclease
VKLRVSPSVGYYPDVMVGCDPEDNHDLYRTRPCLLVEILSPSTSLTDRREKRIAYQDITSLRGYVMVYRDEYRVESYTRNSENDWVHEDLGVDDEVWFPCVNLTVQVRDLYEDVDMPSIMAVTDDPNIR